jgi:hypothetical protein
MSRWTRTTVFTNAEREGVILSALTFGGVRGVASPEFSEAFGSSVTGKLSGLQNLFPPTIKLLRCNEL